MAGIDIDTELQDVLDRLRAFRASVPPEFLKPAPDPSFLDELATAWIEGFDAAISTLNGHTVHNPYLRKD